MPSIALMTLHMDTSPTRQLPVDGHWGGYRFTFNTVEPDCVLVAGFNELARAFSTDLPPSHRVFITSEPPGMDSYNAPFVNQFGSILGPVNVPGFEGQYRPNHPAIPWFYGLEFTPKGVVPVLDYAQLLERKPGAKTAAISATLSTKQTLPLHRERLDFAHALKARLGEKLFLSGRGLRTILDKAEVIDPYRYVLVMENNDLPHFWTEKLADAYLGWALPIYVGCANVGDYFPADSFIRIDLGDRNAAMATIEQVLAQDPWEERLPAIAKARDLVLNRYNLFAELARLADELGPPAARVPAAKIHPTIRFHPLGVRIKAALRANITKPLRRKTRAFRRSLAVRLGAKPRL